MFRGLDRQTASTEAYPAPRPSRCPCRPHALPLAKLEFISDVVGRLGADRCRTEIREMCRMSKSLAVLTATDFEAHREENFRISGTDPELELKLIKVTQLGAALREGGAFSLL